MERKPHKSELFQEEINILKSMLLFVSSEEHRDNSLLPNFKQVVLSYKKLLNIAIKIFRISDRQQLNLKRVEGALKTLLDNAGQGFLTFGYDLLVDREYSAECIKIFQQRIDNANILQLLANSDNEEQNRLFGEAFAKVFQIDDAQAKNVCLQKLPNRIKLNGRDISLECKLISLFTEKREQEAVMLILSDITEKQAAEEQINYLSYHDKLTSLYNRAYIDRIMPVLDNEKQFPISIIMADMNGLKLTNDVFGHEAGDNLLTNMADVFKSCCRQSDIIIRWGGDEFLIILPKTKREVGDAICQRIKQACQEAKSELIELSVAMGVATQADLKLDLKELFSQAEDMMYRNKLVESVDNRRKIIMRLEQKIWAESPEDEEHSKRLVFLAEKIAERLNLNPNEKRDLLQVAYLHDLGNINIPLAILKKPGALTPEEWEIIKKHCEIGYRLVYALEGPKLAEAILAHHEHFNGCGYPKGLKGRKIPLISRIITVIDAYDVMTHERPYKKAVSPEKALEELIKFSGTQFDPVIVREFVKVQKDFDLN